MKRVIAWLEREEQRPDPWWALCLIGAGMVLSPAALLFLGYGLGIR